MISFPAGNEMFQFPALAPRGLYIHPRVMPSTCVVTPGCPIRKSLDQRKFDSSPGLIAAYHVLHRLSIPRHPPYTLSSLITLMKRCRISSAGKPSAAVDNADYQQTIHRPKSPSRLMKMRSAFSYQQSAFSLPAVCYLLPVSSALKWFQLPHTVP